LVFAALDVAYTDRSIETFVRQYVAHFTENAAMQLDKGGYFDSDDADLGSPQDFEDLKDTEMLGHYPTYLAVFSKNGKFIRGHDKLRRALGAQSAWLVSENVDEVVFHDTFEWEKFTIAKAPARSDDYLVVGAVSWLEIPGNTDISVFLWQILAVLMIFWSVYNLVRLLNNILRPIDGLERSLSTLRWGYDALDFEMKGATPTVVRIYDTLVRISKDVVSTVQTHRTYMSDLVNVQEDERTKISRDIHDGPLQDVTALIQRMRLARSPDNTAEDTRRELDLAEKIAFTAVKEMRALCNFLNPPWLELGLSQALTELTERQSVQYGVKIFLGVDEDIELSDTVTLAFFRVVQEAITNSVRHGEAKNIWIDITRGEEGGVELTIQDDGHGFELKEGSTAELRAKGHRGLSNMEERMALVGGRLKIISYKDEGTCIRALLP
jgi:signal transduction histidine kinase